MSTYVTVLPSLKHDGSTTGKEVKTTLALLRARGCEVSAVPGCQGIWIADDGRVYNDAGTFLVLAGSEGAIKTALAYFGQAAGQREVLCVPVQPDEGHVVERRYGYVGAVQLASAHGGATLFPDGWAVSFDYNALCAGVDYDESVLTHL